MNRDTLNLEFNSTGRPGSQSGTGEAGKGTTPPTTDQPQGKIPAEGGEDAAAGLAQGVMARNPFYLISAALVLFGLSRAIASGAGSESPMLLAAILGSYTLLMGLSAVLIARVTRSWKEMASILVILLVLASAMTMVFDERIAAVPEEADLWSLAVFAFLLLLGKGVIRGAGMKLEAGFQAVIFGQLSLFTLSSWLLAQYSGAAAPQQAMKTWIVCAFALASAFFTALQALLVKEKPPNEGDCAVGREAVASGATCPWQYPWHPHVAGLVLSACAALRLFTLDYVYGGAGVILETWFFAPLALSAGFLLLRMALAAGLPTLASATLIALPLTVFLGVDIETEAFRAILSYNSSLFLLFIGFTGLLIYGFAWKRGVKGAESLFWLALLGTSFIATKNGWGIKDFNLPHSPALIILPLAMLLGLRAWIKAWPWILLFSGLLLQWGFGDLIQYEDWTVCAHWTLVYLLLLLRAVRMPRKEAAAFETPAFLLQGLLFCLELFGHIFFENTALHWVYLLILCVFALGYSLLRPSVLMLLAGAVEFLLLLGAGVLGLRCLISKLCLTKGIIEMALGFVVLGFAMLISLRRSRVLATRTAAISQKIGRVFEKDEIDCLLDVWKQRIILPPWILAVFLIVLVTGALMPMCHIHRHNRPAARTNIDSNLKNLAQGVLIQTNANVSAGVTGIFLSPKGIRTLRPGEKGLVEVDGKIIFSLEGAKELEIFTEFCGKDPLGGCYWFLGVMADGTPKIKYSATHRFAMEVPDPRKGDGYIAIVFGDAHIARFPAPRHKLTFEDVRAILSVEGEESLWGEKGEK